MGSKRGRLLMRQSRVKNVRDVKDCDSAVTIAQASPESDEGSPHVHGIMKLERSSPDRVATNQPTSRGPSPSPLREVCVKREASREKLSTVRSIDSSLMFMLIIFSFIYTVCHSHFKVIVPLK